MTATLPYAKFFCNRRPKTVKAPSADEKRALAQAMVGDWLRGHLAGVAEVRREVQKLKVFHYTDPKR